MSDLNTQKERDNKFTFTKEAALASICLLGSLIVVTLNAAPTHKTESHYVCTIKPSEEKTTNPNHYEALDSELKKIKFLHPATRERIKKSIISASKSTGLSEKLIFILIKKESSFRSEVVSSAGAMGLTQLMPATAKHFCHLPPEKIFEIESNVNCGAKYLKRLVTEFNGDLKLALAAYNIGPSHIKRLQKRCTSGNKRFQDIEYMIHPSTKAYVSSINNFYSKTV